MNKARQVTSAPLPPRRDSELWQTLLLGFGAAVGLLLTTLIVLRVCGVIRWFSSSSPGMEPAIATGDHFFEVCMTPRSGAINRGDIILFRTDGIHGLSPAAIYAKRVVGLPGEVIKLGGGNLTIDGKQTSLSNSEGRISMDLPAALRGKRLEMNGAIPRGCYYVLGDDSTNSFDSRYWGCVPRANIIGKAVFCYWPPTRIGRIK